MEDVEIVVFNDKSWVRLTEYLKVKEENEQLKRKIGVMQSCHFNGCIGCNSKTCKVGE